MTRIIKGFAVDWGDRWRRTVWAQRDHIYWFNVSPVALRQRKLSRSSWNRIFNRPCSNMAYKRPLVTFSCHGIAPALFAPR
jgi:hypothetical protein